MNNRDALLNINNNSEQQIVTTGKIEKVGAKLNGLPEEVIKCLNEHLGSYIIASCSDPANEDPNYQGYDIGCVINIGHPESVFITMVGSLNTAITNVYEQIGHKFDRRDATKQ